MSACRVSLDSTVGRFEARPDSRTATLSRIFRPDPNEEHPKSRFSVIPPTPQARSSIMLQHHPFHREDPPLKYHVLSSFSFLIKLAQLLVTVVCAALYTEGLKLITQNISTQMFPNVVYASYLIITSVILLSYLLGQKMPELLIRIFNILASILFFISFALTVTQWAIYRELWAHPLDMLQNNDEDFTQEVLLALEATHYQRVEMLLTQGGFSLLNSALYLIDVVFSIRRTLSYL